MGTDGIFPLCPSAFLGLKQKPPNENAAGIFNWQHVGCVSLTVGIFTSKRRKADRLL